MLLSIIEFAYFTIFFLLWVIRDKKKHKRTGKRIIFFWMMIINLFTLIAVDIILQYSMNTLDFVNKYYTFSSMNLDQSVLQALLSKLSKAPAVYVFIPIMFTAYSIGMIDITRREDADYKKSNYVGRGTCLYLGGYIIFLAMGGNYPAYAITSTGQIGLFQIVTDFFGTLSGQLPKLDETMLLTYISLCGIHYFMIINYFLLGQSICQTIVFRRFTSSRGMLIYTYITLILVILSFLNLEFKLPFLYFNGYYLGITLFASIVFYILDIGEAILPEGAENYNSKNSIIVFKIISIIGYLPPLIILGLVFFWFENYDALPNPLFISQNMYGLFFAIGFLFNLYDENFKGIKATIKEEKDTSKIKLDDEEYKAYQRWKEKKEAE